MGGQTSQPAIYHNYISQIDDKLPIMHNNNTMMYVYSSNNIIEQKELQNVKKRINKWLHENYFTYTFEIILTCCENKKYDKKNWDDSKYKYLLYISWLPKNKY